MIVVIQTDYKVRIILYYGYVSFNFFSVEHGLQKLLNALTNGKDEQLQLQAAWCLTNIATGRPEHTLAVAKEAAPYFIVYISGSTPTLEVLIKELLIMPFVRYYRLIN